MASLLQRLGKLFARPDENPAALAEADRLRAHYRERCAQFRRLLAANKAALEVMAEMEDALRGKRSFGMPFVRGTCARAAANVYQIIRALNALSGDQYATLYQSFATIRQAIETTLAPRQAGPAGPLVLPLDAIGVADARETGGKMSNLGEVRKHLGACVPDGFVVTASGYEHFMAANGLQEEIDRRVQATDGDQLDAMFALSSSIQQLILQAPVPEDLGAAIMEQVQRLQQGRTTPLRIALRSSAVGEDALGASFAGQYRSELNVAPEDALDTWREIVASKYGVTAMTYRHTRGIPDEDVAMCVGGLVMVDAMAGGVAYSRDPMNPDAGTVIINAVLGLPKAVVDGSWSPDMFVLTNADNPVLLERDIARKTARFVCDPVEGVRLEELDPTRQEQPAIDDATAREIALLARRFEAYYGEPQDIEWALDAHGGLVILQSRPIKEARRNEPAPAAEHGATQPASVAEGCVAPPPHGEEHGATSPAPGEEHGATSPATACEATTHDTHASATGIASAATACASPTTSSPTSANMARAGTAADPGAHFPVLLEGGTPVSPGSGVGPAYVVRREMDLLGFPQGGVLVVERALPRWAPLLSRAAAIVAEAGGAAGHLASVAREYGVPALFGLPGALDALSEAGTITVDADNRRIHPGRIEALLDRVPPRNLMEGSPVLAALAEAGRHIIPLHLLDPTAASFSPSHCTTLHDITRFCHEKSVEVMFGTGSDDAPSRERCGKQLKAGVKLQYWVIDIEDGFRKPVPGNVVDLANIQSLPMLALWEGMTAVPWAGPPATDAKGFLSVMFESTANPDLDPAAASALANRNYLMIAKEFCNLQARFGYHFCTVEAQAGDDPHENYASFQFKGGAANPSRRMARARMVADLLEAHGFRADVKEDALFATVEGLDRNATLTRVKLLGHLLIHTRQVDMIMHNEAAATALRTRLHSELATLAAAPCKAVQ